MIREIGRIAWYRLRLDLPRRWTSYVGIVLLVALVGGIALGSIAGARRSESAFPTFLKGTNPSDLAIDVGTYNPKILGEIARLPQVSSLETYVSPNAVPVTASGHVETHSPLFTSDFDPIASLNGLYFNQDRMTIVQGTRPDPRRPDEAMVDEFAARLYGLHVGTIVRLGFFSNAQLGQSSGVPTSPASHIVDVRITGIGVANTEVVQDQIDSIPSMILTPALTRPLVSCCISYAWSGLKLRQGAADVPAVESGYLHLLPPGYPYYFHVTSVIENEAQQAVKPESIALAVFGLIAGLATVLIVSQLMARLILLTTEEREVMWYVGARPVSTATDALFGIAISLLLGAVGAAVVAVALSPLLVFGPLQSVVPVTGFSVDWAALGLGALALVVVLIAVAAALNYRGAPGLRAAGRANRPLRAHRITRAAAGVDAPAPAVLGLRFALEGGRGRTSVPVRSSIFASTLTIVVVVGTLTFGSSLHTLISTPRLYGWNWSAMLESDAGYGNVPQAQAARLLNDDRSVQRMVRRLLRLTPLRWAGRARDRGQQPRPASRRRSCPATKSTLPIRSCWDPRPWRTCTSGSAASFVCPGAPSRPCCTSSVWPPCPRWVSVSAFIFPSARARSSTRVSSPRPCPRSSACPTLAPTRFSCASLRR